MSKLIRDLQLLGGVPKQNWVKIDHKKRIDEFQDEEMPMDQEDKGTETCPFCGQEVECGKLEDHIQEHHPEVVEWYQSQHKEDDQKDIGDEEVDQEKPEITGDEEVDIKIPMESEDKSEQPVKEAANATDKGTMLYSDMPSSFNKPQPEEERKFDISPEVMSQLRDCVKRNKELAKHFEVADNARSKFHEKVIEVAEELIRLLSKRDEMSGKEAAIYLTSLQSSLQHELPPDLWHCMAVTRPNPSLKDYFNVTKKGKK